MKFGCWHATRTTPRIIVTSFDNEAGSGTPVNQVQRTFNDFVQLAEEAQEHDGAVDGGTLAVGYAYANGSANTIRPTSVTYPDGRVLSFGYGTANGDDDELSRIKTLDWNGTDVSEYTYLGAASIVKENYPVPQVALDYIGSGNSYSGFDRFGRVVDQKWTGASGTVDQFRYGYDPNSNRIYRENVVAGQQTTPVHLDELYGYDQLNRLTAAHRGQLQNNDRITDHKLSQTWELDSTGNWKQFSSYDQADADNVLVHQRAHNAVNEITAIGETVGDQWVTPQHDRNGNMTTIPQPSDPTQSYTCVWDAWNRLVEVKDGAATIGRYDYDGLGRRIRKYVPGSPDSYQHFYFNDDWQLLETREASTAPVRATAQYQYVWSLRYIDAPVLRDDRAATPDEVLYYLGDANFNVTTLTDTSGNPVERYVYDPYGKVTIYNPGWSATRISSLFNNSTLYTGRWLDEETGLYYYRARYYDAELGKFISRDPLEYDGSERNRYEYVGGNPPNDTDPSGLIGKIAVYINMAGSDELDSPFDASAVETKVNAMLSAAGSAVQVSIFETTRSKEAVNPGFKFRTVSWNYNSPYCGWVTNSLIDTWNWTFREVTFYDHYVTFNTQSLKKLVARTDTSGKHTEIFVKGTNDALQSARDKYTSSKVQPNVVYANIIAHEVLWLGVMDYYGDCWFCETGTLGSKHAGIDPITITASEAAIIDSQMKNR